jgi:hypothetical protein
VDASLANLQTDEAGFNRVLGDIRASVGRSTNPTIRAVTIRRAASENRNILVRGTQAWTDAGTPPPGTETTTGWQARPMLSSYSGTRTTRRHTAVCPFVDRERTSGRRVSTSMATTSIRPTRATPAKMPTRTTSNTSSGRITGGTVDTPRLMGTSITGLGPGHTVTPSPSGVGRRSYATAYPPHL